MENRITARHIQIVTPASVGSRRGNRITAERWQSLLATQGHDTAIAERYQGENVDLMIAIHASRSADSIRRFRAANPNRRLVVAVTGTDIYGHEFDAIAVNHSLQVADHILVLQPRTADDLGPQLLDKVRVIYQSAEPPANREPHRTDCFEVAVVGHLRPVKDPFRTAAAARLLSANSRIHIVHLGEAYSPTMAEQARSEMATNPRYEWLGDVPHQQALSILARSRLAVLTSLSEGGPAVIAEALIAGVPMLGSRVAGCVGMLGEDYPGLFTAGDTRELACLLERAELEADFYNTLLQASAERRPLFTRARELAAWQALLEELGSGVATTPARSAS